MYILVRFLADEFSEGKLSIITLTTLQLSSTEYEKQIERSEKIIAKR